MAKAVNVTCSKCNAKIPEFGKFCESCGTAVGSDTDEFVQKPETKPDSMSVASKEAASNTATNPAKKDGDKKDQKTTPAENVVKIIEDSPLAKGLPEWNIEPPVIAVRRKSKVS